MKNDRNDIPCGIAVTGGKGGIGKTSIALNLGLALARAGRRVILLDADLGLGNVDILLGLNPARNLGHMLRGECSIKEVVTEGPWGMRIVPAASGVDAMANLSGHEHTRLVDAVHELACGCDYLIVDTAAGIATQVLAFTLAVERILLVLMNEPAALTDAYGLVKVLSRQYGRHRFDALCNQVSSERAGRMLYEHFCSATDRFLDVSIGYVGDIPYDPALKRAARARKPLLEYAPRAPAAVAITTLAQSLLCVPQLNGPWSYVVGRDMNGGAV
jgi:flagellar biosynthesis protein FlhG